MRAPWFPLLLALAAAGVVVAEVLPGDVRSAQARDGVPVRERPKPLANPTTRLEYGTRVTVLEVEGAWARVRTDAAVEGWVRASDLVEPAALTGGGAAGPASPADVTAAGRQFDESIEGDFKASDAAVAAAYAQVDALERARWKPGDAAVVAFLREGRLGRDDK